MKHSKNEPRITRSEALNVIPVKSVEIEEIQLETGEVLLRYSLKVRPWASMLIRWFGRESDSVQKKKLQLDVLGTAVWRLLDGDRSVREVIQLFSDQHQLHPKEAEVSVTQFLRELGKRGIIGLKSPKFFPGPDPSS
jgi:hypothetical protein